MANTAPARTLEAFEANRLFDHRKQCHVDGVNLVYTGVITRMARLHSPGFWGRALSS